jgi:hypothetical protein
MQNIRYAAIERLHSWLLIGQLSDFLRDGCMNLATRAMQLEQLDLIAL